MKKMRLNKIQTRFNLGDRVMAQIFPGKFEWCDIVGVYVSLELHSNPAYQMDNGLLVREAFCFQTREDAIEWAEHQMLGAPHDEKT